MTILDTNAFLYDALKPEKLSRAASRAIEKASQRDELAICGISLWEIAMLASRGRIEVSGGVALFLEKALIARNCQVLNITPAIAAISAAPAWHDWDPADCIIAATALDRRADLVTSDQRLQRAKEIQTIW